MRIYVLAKRDLSEGNVEIIVETEQEDLAEMELMVDGMNLRSTGLQDQKF